MSIKIKIEGEGLFYEGETDILKASHIIGFISAENATKSPLNEFSFNKASTSPRESIKNSGAKSNAEKIVALGKYICQRDSQDAFSIKEAQEVMRKTGEPFPKNFSRDLGEAVRRGYIFEKEKGTYSLTEAGESTVQNGFSGDEPTNSSRKKKGLTRKRVVSPEIKELEVSTVAEGLPDYWKLNSKASRALWILAISNTHGIQELSSVDVSHIATRLRDKIEAKQLPSLTNTLLKKGYLSVNSGGKYRILQKGLDYLKDTNPVNSKPT